MDQPSTFPSDVTGEKTPREESRFLSSNGDNSQKRNRKFWEAIGIYGIVALLLGTFAILGAVTFLSFLWMTSQTMIRGGPVPPLWNKIVSNGWTSRVVTLSSVVIRSAVTLQGALVSAMVAALLLERQG